MNIKTKKQLNFNYYFYFLLNYLIYFNKSNFIIQKWLNNICMKKIFIMILLIFSLAASNVLASTIEGAVSEEGNGYSSRIIDKNTGLGISGAKVSLPKQNYTTTTDSDGFFVLDTHFDGTTILSVQKDNYKPYSVTLQSGALSTPIVIGIERANSSGLVLDSNMYHLGDNNYSELSANAGEFKMATIGPFYTKRFVLKNLKFNKPIFLVIGSIIGIDTDMARSIGQNKIANAFASAPEIYFNGNKISEIQINGDGQKIKLPSSLIKRNQVNEITIRTGHNLMQTAYIDYDDIEFMNLFIEN